MGRLVRFLLFLTIDCINEWSKCGSGLNLYSWKCPVGGDFTGSKNTSLYLEVMDVSHRFPQQVFISIIKTAVQYLPIPQSLLRYKF